MSVTAEPMKSSTKKNPEKISRESMVPGKAPALARAATLADIAEHVGVSRVAASVVLNNSKSQVRVSEETRRRIIEAAKQLNYQPNALARSLLRQRTDIIGFYSAEGKMFDPVYPFYGSVMKGLLKGCEQHKKNLLVHGTFYDVSEDAIFLELLNGQIDGLVLYARNVTPLIERLQESRLPVVTVADEVPGLPYITVDDEQGGRLLARHLASKGYRKVLYWVADAVLPSTIEHRLHGFKDEASVRGIDVEVYHPKGRWPFEEDLDEILTRKDRPEVLAAYSDFLADHFYLLCLQRGVRVPQDLAITGFDGFASRMRPSAQLTTVAAPWDEVAHKAVSLLVAQCSGEAVPRSTILPVSLIEGDTA